MEDAHAQSVDDVTNYFNVDTERGLSLDQVKRNQEKYGANGKRNSSRNLSGFPLSFFFYLSTCRMYNLTPHVPPSTVHVRCDK